MSERQDVEFVSGGQRCSAWLYLPRGRGPAPVIVMAHGLGAVREMRLDAYAERFQAAGYACLVFDYRHLGASEGEPRQLLDVQRQLEDWRSAIRYVRGRSDVQTDKVILWGTSFSGGHVIETAAGDGQIAALIAQCPFTDGLASARVMHPVSALKVTALAVKDLLSAARGGPPVTAATVGPKGTAAFMTADDAQVGYLALVPPGLSFPNHLAARLGLQIMRYRPGLKAAALRCPAMFCICETDSVAPAAATLRHVRKAPRGEVRIYREGHFDIYVDQAFERVVADQLSFLQRQVPAPGRRTLRSTASA